ncbi:hypothetical protein, partial [Mesorhizobium sp. M7A.F.Ca.CA.002.05.1.1]|uniref:hypothetical protein n=1 Tax=Mesorhizobium sp. M7A.F.Ca.CA.002.05.1.1 TaxID=2496704 RepID=UPI0019D145CF
QSHYGAPPDFAIECPGRPADCWHPRCCGADADATEMAAARLGESRQPICEMRATANYVQGGAPFRKNEIGTVLDHQNLG